MTDKPTLDQWSAAADKEVKGKDLTWATPEGIDERMGPPTYGEDR